MSASGEMIEVWTHTGDIDTSITGYGDGSSGSGTWKILCSFNQDVIANWTYGETTSAFLPPINQNRWKLYPKAYIQKQNRTLKISKWGGRKEADGGGYVSGVYNWWNRMWFEGSQDTTCFTIDLNVAYDYTDSAPVDSIYEQGGVVSGRIVNLFPSMILQPTERFLNTNGANMMSKLGFADSVLFHAEATSVGTKDTYVGDKLPELSSDVGLFVKLNNFTQKSYNAGVGRPSKVLYVMPRFDNAGNYRRTRTIS